MCSAAKIDLWLKEANVCLISINNFFLPTKLIHYHNQQNIIYRRTYELKVSERRNIILLQKISSMINFQMRCVLLQFHNVSRCYKWTYFCRVYLEETLRNYRVTMPNFRCILFTPSNRNFDSAFWPYLTPPRNPLLITLPYAPLH